MGIWGCYSSTSKGANLGSSKIWLGWFQGEMFRGGGHEADRRHAGWVGNILVSCISLRLMPQWPRPRQAAENGWMIKTLKEGRCFGLSTLTIIEILIRNQNFKLEEIIFDQIKRIVTWKTQQACYSFFKVSLNKIKHMLWYRWASRCPADEQFETKH